MTASSQHWPAGVAPGFTTRPELTGTFGMVAASHWLAAQSGMSMLEAGGNAFDAAAAAGFVLQVVEPHMNGPGGEAPIVAYPASEGAVVVVDGQGPAPSSATPERFSELGLELVPGSGLLAACVPGAIGAWLLLLERFGTMSLRKVLTPAIGYAGHGFPALASLSSAISGAEETMRSRWPTSAALWLSHGVPAAGTRLRNTLLAATYERILAEAEAAGPGRAAQLEGARRAVYEGFVAETIDSFVRSPQRTPASPRSGAGFESGLLSGEDLASWQARLEEPVRFSYGPFEVCKTGPWGQGPVFLQQLALLSGVEVAGMEPGSAELVHTVTECAKLAFADREAFYGDPRFVDVPLDELLSPAYNDGRRKLIAGESDSSVRPGSPGGREPRLPSLLPRLVRAGASAPGQGSATGASVLVEGEPTASTVAEPPGPGDTCHVDVADRFGNLVSATPSGGWLQSSPAVPGLGFCLGTRAQMFWVEDGLASSIAPRKRPRTTLSPTMALRDGAPALAFGTPGGDQQDQWTLLFFIYHADLGFGLQAAVDAANWHTNHFPSSFFPRAAPLGELVVEESLGSGVVEELRERGHLVVGAPAWSRGRVTVTAIGEDGLLRAAADPRGGQAYAVGR